jgi:hypothetical protein
MPKYQRNLPNFYIAAKGDSQNYTSPGGGGRKKSFPPRNRIQHAETLKQAFEKALENYQQQKLLREPELSVEEAGFYLEFQIPKSELKALDSLENKTKNIELVAVKSSDESEETVSATVFVPEKASDFFALKIEAYRDKETEKGNPKNEPLIACLDDISLGTVRALFTDNLSSFPSSESQEVWWEVWLRHGYRESFQRIAEILNIRTTEHFTFPEREVVLTLTSITTLSRIIINNGLIAELRLAKDSPSIFFEMDMQEEISWVKELARRTVIAPNTNLAVCLLDSGVTRAHPLIEPALAPEDCLTCHPDWGVADSKNGGGHGTGMAGLVLYGNLYNALETSNRIYLNHRLESVKILPDQGENDRKLYGTITKEAVSRAIVSNPKRQRVICMPVTSPGDNKGVPSSWSAAVDQICFEFQRLMVIPVGNIRKPIDIILSEYPSRNDLSPAENPSQAWNALVVGAYTDKVNMQNPKYAKWQTIAPAGDLSPRSRTSLLWADKWPIRPDVTFEGGNLAIDDASSPAMDLYELRQKK